MADEKEAVKKTADKPAATKKAAAPKAAAEKAPAKAAAPKKAAAEPAEAREHVLKVHHLRPAPGAKKAKQRVGRGEGSKGKTAGRGTKGTKARYKVRIGFEGGQMPLHMRTPKLRGFKNPFRVEYQVVNLVLHAERVLEAAKLRGAHVQRHLPTLEADANLVASLRALGSTTRGLTLGSLTTANALLGLLRTGSGAKVVNLQHVLAGFSGLSGGLLGCGSLGRSLCCSSLGGSSLLGSGGLVGCLLDSFLLVSH